MVDHPKPVAFPWKHPAIWLTLIIIAMMAFNAWQAWTNPASFAQRFGVEGAADADHQFILVYASRALFLAVIAAILLAWREFAALGLFALAAVIMPVADAFQVSAASAPTTIIARHVAIAAYLLLTSWSLRHLAKSQRG